MEAIQERYQEDRLFNEIKTLRNMIIDFEKKLNATQTTNESPELNKLFDALAKAQMDMEVAKTDNSNPFFKSKYADLASVVKASRPHLVKQGLAVAQFTRETSAGQILHTRLCHSSGQWLESQMHVRPLKADPQTLGSTLTYLRRYMYASLVGVVASDEDDDGEIAMKGAREPRASKNTISKTQLANISNELQGQASLGNIILKEYKIDKLADLQEKDFNECMSRVRSFKVKKSVVTA
jgi:hypothetical protein